MAAKASKKREGKQQQYVSRRAVVDEIWDEHFEELDRAQRQRKPKPPPLKKPKKR